MIGRRTPQAPGVVARLDSPLGPLFAEVDDEGRLVRLDFAGRGPALNEAAADDAGAAGSARLAAVAAELGEYFAGGRRSFSLRLAPRGTEFQRRVWQELCRIPYGTTISYRELATRLGNPAATRAVARANATNPIAIVVPCHRVIGADGTLTGYGGGLDRKQRLLELEGARLPTAVPAPRGLFAP